MIRALLLLALGLAACANVQDLGTDRPTSSSTPSQPASEPGTGAAITPSLGGICPAHAPTQGADCAVSVGWCSYRVAPREGLAAKCACGSDRRWSCLLVRDDDRRNELPVEKMRLTAASCTEGAPCGEGTKCTVGKERACECMSSGRLRCERPIF